MQKLTDLRGNIPAIFFFFNLLTGKKKKSKENKNKLVIQIAFCIFYFVNSDFVH